MSKDNENAWGWDPDSKFPTTEWTKILGAGLGKSVMGELYGKYGKPVYSYLRHKGKSDEEAKDIVQGFFTDRVLGQQLFQKADRTRGRFRTFLLTAIRNYAIDLHRHSRPTQELKEEFEQPDFAEGPEAAFNIVWAQQLLQDVLAELEAECSSRDRDKGVHWEIFSQWFLEPSTSDQKVRMTAICTQCGIADPSRAYNMIANLKGRFRVILRGRLRRQVGSEDEVDDEIKSLIQVFSQCSTRK